MSDRLQLSPDQVISDIHTLAGEMGATRTRVDRSTWEDPECWIEVGYACQWVHIRTNDPTIQYRRAVLSVEMDDVIQLFETLLDRNPEEKTQ